MHCLCSPASLVSLCVCCLWSKLWACSSGYTQPFLFYFLACGNLFSSEVWMIMGYIFLDFFLLFFYSCTCNAVRGKSLQPHSEMMSQIHKTLTSPFQLLFIIYHPYFIFLWEELYVCAWAYIHLRALHCIVLWIRPFPAFPCLSVVQLRLVGYKALCLFLISKWWIFALYVAQLSSQSSGVLLLLH